jgi:RHS repeat-associated protein
VAAADAASYSVTLTNSAGTVTSAVAALSVAAARTENVTVGPVGGSAELVLIRTYSNGAAGEVLASQQLGSTNPAVTFFDYYTNPAQSANWGFTKSVTVPGGGWEAYDYYDSPTGAPPRIGQVMRRYRPFGAAPATVTQVAAQGEVTYFEYGADAFGYQTQPTLVRTTVNDVLVSQSTTTYSPATGPYSSVAMLVATQADLAAGTTVLTTVRATYADSAGDAFIRGQPHSITAPDGTITVWDYDRGAWNGTTFAPASPTANGPGAGTASRIMVTSNRNTSLVDGKSTRETAIRDERALVVRTENSVWKNGGWQLVGWANFTYNLAGLLTQRVTSTGATYSAVYNGLQKMSETDETGATVSYTYDVAGRVLLATRAASGSLAAVTTRYTYDAAGRVVTEQVGWGAAEQLMSTKIYDDAGRLVSETSPGVAATTHTYNVAARSHITTLPSAATRIETAGLDGRLVSVEGTAVVAEYRTYGVDSSSGRRWEQVNLGAANSPRWRKTWKDRLGREVLIQRPVFPGQPAYTEENFYNDTAGQSSTGHLVKNKKTGTNATLYVYDSLGRVMRSGLDANSSGALEPLSADRLSESDTILESFNGAWWWRTETRGYAEVASATPVITSISRQRLTGFTGNLQAETQTTDILGNVSTQKREVVRATATVTSSATTVGVPLPEVTTAVQGLTTAVTGRDGLTTTFGYDALRRRTTVVGPRNTNTTATAYKTGTGLVETVKVLNAASAAISTTTYTYDTSGRQTALKDPGQFESFTSYTARGQVHRQWGAAALPVEYDYDASYGERTVMRTYRAGTDWSGTSWPASPGTADATTWAYDPGTGLLTSKIDAANRAVTYSYFSTGQLARRTWARGVTTDYYYDSITGEQRDIESNDGTPTLHYTYNRLGQVSRIDDGTGFRTQTHCLCGKLATEQLDPSFYGGRLLTYVLETATTSVRGRSLGYTLTAGATVEQQTTYAYDTASRLSTLATQTTAAVATRTFRYGYLAQSDLLNSLTIDGNTAFAVNRSFEDKRDVLTAIDTVWGTSRARFDYVTNALGQRTSAQQSGEAFADNGPATYQTFGYDGRGQLTAAPTYLGTAASDSQTLHGRQYAYEFDNIGNRTSDNRAKNNPEALRNTYTTNALNQYTAKTNKSLAASGTTQDDPALNVAVQAGGKTVKADRLGRIWNAELSALDSNGVNASGLNTNGPWRDLLTVYTGKAGSPANVQTSVRLAQIAALNQTFEYDLDGNLTFDGVWNYVWDAENRLIRQTTAAGAVTAGLRNIALEYRYDYLGRRVQKLVIDATANRLIYGRRFLYDGWNLIAEYALNAQLSAPTLVSTYTWGLDIARTFADAGGVGALLQITDHTSARSFVPAYDGNGNIVALLNASSGELAAAYEYSPFGEPIRAQSLDSATVEQPFRFSTKYTDSETGLVYYGRRYYSPSQGRFVGRDPIGEKGGKHLYGFCENNGVNRWDLLGMLPKEADGSGSDDDDLLNKQLWWSLNPPNNTSSGTSNSGQAGSSATLAGAALAPAIPLDKVTVTASRVLGGTVVEASLWGYFIAFLLLSPGDSYHPPTTTTITPVPEIPIVDNAAKAPGQPTAADGYVPPKNWNGEKVPSPNGGGYGYPDRNGDVWVPTGNGPTAHGGPHWDVQEPGGDYRNVFPTPPPAPAPSPAPKPKGE